MQADKEVGKMVAEVPILMGKLIFANYMKIIILIFNIAACAVEMLLADILKSANAIRLQGMTKLLTAAHL